MKKRISFALATMIGIGIASAQVLESPELKNTVWTGFGNPNDADTMFYGLTDVFQARIDSGKLSMEGMLNWGFLANYDNKGNIDNFQLGTTNKTAKSIHYGRDGRPSNNSNAYSLNNSPNVQNMSINSYYVNFFYAINENLDFGIGTDLNWKVGPAPSYGDAFLWESKAHIRQGGFSTAYNDNSGAYVPTSNDSISAYRFYIDKPGEADVVGFIPYANVFAKRALGLKYESKGNVGLKFGAAIPNGFNTDDPLINLGAEIAPTETVLIAASAEGLGQHGINFYTGGSFNFGSVLLDVYFAADSLNTDESDDEAYGTGFALTFTSSKSLISIKPELGINFFQNDDYTPAWYTGVDIGIPIHKDFRLSIWTSIAFGSEDEKWDNYNVSKDYDGGFIFNMKPSLAFTLSTQTTISVDINYEHREAFDDTERNCWSSGVFIEHRF